MIHLHEVTGPAVGTPGSPGVTQWWVRYWAASNMSATVLNKISAPCEAYPSSHATLIKLFKSIIDFQLFFIFNVSLNLNCTWYTPICAWTGSNLVKESCWKRQEATSIGAVKVRPFIVFPLEQWCTLMIACWKTGTIWNFIDGSKICDNIQLER